MKTGWLCIRIWIYYTYIIHLLFIFHRCFIILSMFWVYVSLFCCLEIIWSILHPHRVWIKFLNPLIEVNVHLWHQKVSGVCCFAHLYKRINVNIKNDHSVIIRVYMTLDPTEFHWRWKSILKTFCSFSFFPACIRHSVWARCCSTSNKVSEPVGSTWDAPKVAVLASLWPDPEVFPL